MATEDLNRLKKETGNELLTILEYWAANTVDHENGGFFGKIDHYNKVIPEAPKGIILNTRILWAFSSASIFLKTHKYKEICDRAYHYLTGSFLDRAYGGMYWETDYQGNVVNDRKQTYAQAFAVYAFTEYYKAFDVEEAKSLAIEIFRKLEIQALDLPLGGYLEAFDRKWDDLEDMRLSSKDMNVAKTMNTHLHVLEAYTSLYTVYPDKELKSSLEELVHLFLEKFLDLKNHYHLFFDREWKLCSNTISFGHDIEAAWLIIEAARILGNKPLLQEAKEKAIEVAYTFLSEAVDSGKAVLNENRSGVIDRDRHWWPQVEAMVGLGMVYQFNKDEKILKTLLTIWDYTSAQLIDRKNGEWFFRVDENGRPYEEEDKVSMWKAPYHTVRAMIKMNTLFE